eukprot:1151007-Pelagomonas_calceolata.AAC.2
MQAGTSMHARVERPRVKTVKGFGLLLPCLKFGQVQGLSCSACPCVHVCVNVCVLACQNEAALTLQRLSLRRLTQFAAAERAFTDSVVGAGWPLQQLLREQWS